ncbi:MAG: hypothetical protein LC789_03235 [Actinobacteria bacterium]|nr:hypothetical protein [Actinomycetota bacterium]MCA1719873.1 hypothetical protein [Actinomycetota bacterium]
MRHASTRLSALVAAALAVGAGAALVGGASASADPPANDVQYGAESRPAVAHATSQPVRDMPRHVNDLGAPSEAREPKPVPAAPSTRAADTQLQTTTTATTPSTPQVGFAGVGNGDYGFAVNSAPPDTSGAAGTTQYVQWVNQSFAVFPKVTSPGTAVVPLKGPISGNTLFSALGGGCAANNDGDPIVQFDKIAKRWVLSQFSVSTKPYLECVAVSKTDDATGAYNLYAFDYGSIQFNDYPKMSVWPDGYYVTYNIFNRARTFAGAKACALDRAAMIAGTAATQQCFQLSTSYNSLMPADVDGATLPPAGTPALLVSKGSSALNSWRFHADFTNAANATLTGPTTVPVPAFNAACSACVPQQGTSQQLDTLGDRMMFRLAYRRLSSTGTDGDLVITHTVNAGLGTAQLAPRWYHLKLADGATTTPTLVESGTYAPDSAYRWMGSIAMDKLGNIALGYSKSSSTTHPSVQYAGRTPADPLGKLGSELNINSPLGSQLSNLSRWGDYSDMTIDPVDDCTFWYTTEDLKTSGTFNWNTVIANFKLGGCS